MWDPFQSQTFDSQLLVAFSAGKLVSVCFIVTTVRRYRNSIIMPPPLGKGALSDDARLTSVCLSVAYIGPKSRTERPRKTKIGTEVAHVTRDSDTTFYYYVKVRTAEFSREFARRIRYLL